MPIETVPDCDLQYHLVAFDRQGNERQDDPDGMMSERVLESLQDKSVTDVVLMCHGWLRDVPASRKHYAGWVQMMAQCRSDRERLGEVRPGFKPLLIGLHWPSLPWGDEDLGGESGPSPSFSQPGAVPGGASAEAAIDRIIDSYAECLSDSPTAKEALRKIVSAAVENLAAEQMPVEIADAYHVIDKESKMNSAGGFISEGVGREPFDPDDSFRMVEEEVVSFGGFDWGGLLWPLRQLSFWKMKDRARVFGQRAGFPFLRRLQSATDARIHLSGHSFGCVALSAALAGPDEPNELVRPVDSLVLIQAAMSLWAFSAARPGISGPGYFSSVITDQRVAGPIVATYSEHDTALVRVYPMAAGLAGQVSFGPGEEPKYGAAGAYGFRGPGLTVVDREMIGTNDVYEFQPRIINNLESSQFIKRGWGLVGAHNDITEPQVVHAAWQAMYA